MSAYEDRTEYPGSRYYDERRYERDPNYAYSRDNYTKGQATSRDLIPRHREDSDYSVEEIHRDFPPQTSRDVYRSDYAYDDDRRTRSSKYDRREGKTSRSSAGYDDDRKRRRMISNQEKILAAIIGGAIAVGGKELYDRREAHAEGKKVQRNALSSAALGAAGALAAYQGAELYGKHAAKEKEKEGQKALTYKSRESSRRSAYSDYDSDGDSDPKEHKGYKKFVESALAAAGLGGAVKALTGDSDSRSETRSRRGSRSRSDDRSSSHGKSKGKGTNKVQKAAMASLIAGATEAFRVAKEPGSWKGEKAKRIFTAAAGAATLDAAQDDKHSKLGLAESVIGGLLGNRLVNGSRKDIEEDRRTGRSRSRSRARSSGHGGGSSSNVSGLAALATAGLGALGTKKILDHRSRSRSRRDDSADSYDDDHRKHRSRSRSVVDSARRSLAKIGLGNGPDDDDDWRDDAPRREKGSSRHHSRRDSGDSYDDDRHHSSSGRDRDRDYDRDHDRDRTRASGRRHDDDDDRSTRRRSGSRTRHSKGGADSDTDLGSSSGDEKQARKMRDGRHRH